MLPFLFIIGIPNFAECHLGTEVVYVPPRLFYRGDVVSKPTSQAAGAESAADINIIAFGKTDLTQGAHRECDFLSVLQN